MVSGKVQMTYATAIIGERKAFVNIVRHAIVCFNYCIRNRRHNALHLISVLWNKRGNEVWRKRTGFVGRQFRFWPTFKLGAFVNSHLSVKWRKCYKNVQMGRKSIETVIESCDFACLETIKCNKSWTAKDKREEQVLMCLELSIIAINLWVFVTNFRRW